jgi:hypothetical protein
MDNLKLPAHPTTIANANEVYEIAGRGFTKLELASLMIAQGLCADPNVQQSVESIGAIAVSIAKAVLEEANK